MKKEGKSKLELTVVSLIIVISFAILVLAVPTWKSGVEGPYNVSEDTIFTYNFSNNLTNYGEVQTYSFISGSLNVTPNPYGYSGNDDFYWISLNDTTGVLTINSTHNNETGYISMQVLADNSTHSSGTTFYFNISAVNDAPRFLNLGENRTLNKSFFELILQASDEENDIPFVFNVSFMQCTHTALDPPTGPDNCKLFNLTYFNQTATNISFTPSDNQKGEYKINFTVMDSLGANYSETFNWTLTWNDPPRFTYVCDNELSATEDTEHTCWINATDPDEQYNITFISNETWFTFNTTQSTTEIIDTIGGNASALVNFTATDTAVGTWNVNITITDTGAVGESTLSNSTIISFFVDNVNDSVELDPISDITEYTSNNQALTILVNATDSDLLIPDESVLNEVLEFHSNNSNVQITSEDEIVGTNKTRATITYNPATLGAGVHKINISVNDFANWSVDSEEFTITVIANDPPVWDVAKANHTIVEGNSFNYNLTQNVTDADGDPISFTYVNFTAFPSLYFNETTGIMNFTAGTDADVGYHKLTVNATDGKTSVPQDFNITITNVNDLPSIQSFPSAIINATNNGVNITATEDNITTITLRIDDDDFEIPSDQKDYYQENLTLSLTITGPNTNLFNFSITDDFSSPSGPQGAQPQRIEYDAIFTPNKSDIGNYQVSLTATDESGASDTLQFNVTVNEIQHSPTMDEVGNLEYSIEETIYIDINSTDPEDIDEDFAYSNLTYKLENLTTGGNFLTINETTGVINLTLDSTRAGFWQYNVSVNDSNNDIDFELFNLTVYDYPQINSPLSSQVYNLKENVTAELNFSVNDTVGMITNNTLNYSIYINGILKNTTLGNGNSTDFLWYFTPNFTDETTCTGVVNLTLNVSNAKLSNTTSWNVTINHTNFPLTLQTNIPDQSGGSPRTITLSDYFIDYDASDVCQNQTIDFTHSKIEGDTAGAISVSLTSWEDAGTPEAEFTSSSSAIANYTITALEYNGTDYINTVLSNNFSVEISVSQRTVTTSGGGGGGGGSITPVSLRIIVPEKISVSQKDKVLIPIKLQNSGKITLNKITLSSTVAKDGIERNDFKITFDKDFIDTLPSKGETNVTMTVEIDTLGTGLYEITIDADVQDPTYDDSAKVFLDVFEGEGVFERIVFTQEFIVSNPECAELQEIVNEAQQLLSMGDTEGAKRKAQEAIDACSDAISQPVGSKLRAKLGDNVFGYLTIASVAAIFLGFGFYYYKRAKFRKQMQIYNENI